MLFGRPNRSRDVCFLPFCACSCCSSSTVVQDIRDRTESKVLTGVSRTTTYRHAAIAISMHRRAGDDICKNDVADKPVLESWAVCRVSILI